MEYFKLFVLVFISAFISAFSFFNIIFWLMNKIKPEPNLYPRGSGLFYILFPFGCMLVPLLWGNNWTLGDYFACSLALSLTPFLSRRFIWDKKKTPCL